VGVGQGSGWQVEGGGPLQSWGVESGSRSLQATQAWGIPGEVQRGPGRLVLLLWEIGVGSFQAGQVAVGGTFSPRPWVQLGSGPHEAVS
jgi:hypothetical protein